MENYFFGIVFYDFFRVAFMSCDKAFKELINSVSLERNFLKL